MTSVFGLRAPSWAVAAAVAAPLTFMSHSAKAIPVSLELSLLIDVSGSVDATEFALQRDGYVAAFNSPAIQTAVTSNPIAVNFIQWASGNEQSTSIGFTLVNDAATASAFAASISGIGRAFNGNTAPGSAIAFAVPLFTNNFEGTRLVIDVSGDGIQNSGIDTSNARDAALAAGVTTINGLPIGDASIATFYQNNIVGGSNGFLVAANDFADFSAAISQKLSREITNDVPEPASLALLGLGLAGLSAVRRRRG